MPARSIPDLIAYQAHLATDGRGKPGIRRPRNDVSGGPNVDSRPPASHRGRLCFVSVARMSLVRNQDSRWRSCAMSGPCGVPERPPIIRARCAASERTWRRALKYSAACPQASSSGLSVCVTSPGRSGGYSGRALKYSRFRAAWTWDGTSTPAPTGVNSMDGQGSRHAHGGGRPPMERNLSRKPIMRVPPEGGTGSPAGRSGRARGQLGRDHQRRSRPAWRSPPPGGRTR